MNKKRINILTLALNEFLLIRKLRIVIKNHTQTSTSTYSSVILNRDFLVNAAVNVFRLLFGEIRIR